MTMNKHSIGDYFIAEYNRSSTNEVDNVYLIDTEHVRQYLFAEDVGRVGYPDCMKSDENLNIIADFIKNNFSKKCLCFQTLVDNEMSVGKDNVTFQIIRNLVDNCLQTNRYKIDTLYNTTNLVYNPIENYDRKEITSTKINGNETDTRTGSEERSKSGSDTLNYKGGTTTTPTGSTVNTHKVTAYNEPTELATESQDSTSYDGMSTTDTFNDRHDETVYNSNDKVTFDNYKNEHSFNNRENVTDSKISGNIGVTTTQQMIESERDVAEFNVFSVIADMVQESFTTSEWVSMKGSGVYGYEY